MIEKAKTTGITMAQVREMTGWSKTGGFYGAIKRAGLTTTRRQRRLSRRLTRGRPR